MSASSDILVTHGYTRRFKVVNGTRGNPHANGTNPRRLAKRTERVVRRSSSSPLGYVVRYAAVVGEAVVVEEVVVVGAVEEG